MVYFLKAANGLIKIGYSKNVQKRLRGLQAASPVPLRLLGCIPGDRQREVEFHTLFAPLQHHNEWFHGKRILLDFIQTVLRYEETKPRHITPRALRIPEPPTCIEDISSIIHLNKRS